MTGAAVHSNVLATIDQAYAQCANDDAESPAARVRLARALAVSATLLATVGVLASNATVAVVCVLSVVTACASMLSRRLRTATRGAERSLAAAGPTLPAACGFRWLLDRCPDAVVLTDVTGAVVRTNRAWADLAGTAVDAASGLAALTVLSEPVTDAESFVAVVRELYAKPEQAGQGEVTFSGDRVRLCAWFSEPLHDDRGRIVGRGFYFHDRTQERELAALKSDFLSTVTHELRTPLTSVKGSLQLVLGKASALSAVDRELLDISLKNTDRLIRLINDILDISQLELGKIDLAFTTVATASLVEEAVAGLRAYAAGRDIALACDLEPELPPVDGDRDRLIQVLTNLISNAVKFSAPGGRVVVRASRSADGLAIAVRDWGIGIDAHDQPRLFQRFQRLNPGSSDEPGTGLGLAISKAIVERHGGRIVVDSRAAEGSTFTVVIPLPADVPQLAPAASEEHEGEATGRPTLLLVDDDVDLGTVLEVSLRDSFRVLRVERGVQALDVARTERPDLVLLDVVLPDLSGYDVLRILQHSEATGGIPVVMLTVQPERELAWRLGATDVVAKPIDIDELRRAVTRTLRRRAPGSGLRVALGPLPSRSSGELAAALEAGGHAVYRAGDAWELLRSVAEHAADVAVVEADGGGDSDSTVAFVRGHAATRHLPLVLLTDGPEHVAAAGCTSIARACAAVDIVRAVAALARTRVAA